MNIRIIEAGALQRAVKDVGAAVSGRATLPILSFVRLRADEAGRLTVTATDLELAEEIVMPARVSRAGEITVPHKLVSDWLGAVHEDSPLDVSLPEGELASLWSCNGHEAKFRGEPPDEFPIVGDRREGFKFSLSGDQAAVMAESIGQVVFAAATDESRPILTGVLVDFDPEAGQVTLAAANGSVLSVTQRSMAIDLDRRLQMIVPARALRELAKMLPDEVEGLELAGDAGRMQFRWEDAMIEAGLIEGNFLVWDQIVPSQVKHRIYADVAEFKAGLRVVRPFARAGSGLVRMRCEAGQDEGEGRLVLTAQAVEYGDGRADVPADVPAEAEGFEIAFDWGRMAPWWGICPHARASIGMITASSPMLMEPASGWNRFVLMPMQTR